MGVPAGSPAIAWLKRMITSNACLRMPYLAFRRSMASARLLRQHLYDFSRVRKYSSAVRLGDSKEKLSALLTMAFHSLEKGMSLSQPRPGFGQAHVRTVISRLDRYLTFVGPDDLAAVSLNVLRSYQRFNHRNNVSLPWLDEAVLKFSQRISNADRAETGGGVRDMSKEQFLQAAKIDLEAFFQERCSVRQYSKESVAPETLEKAVRMAQKSPSVCNRQSSRVWILSTEREVSDALNIQGGARGFDSEVSTVLVITSDLSAFQSSGERNQCWIDGGLFAMSLIYALHSLGLVSCCLNWSKTRDTDLRFKDRFKIPESESIIMLLSVGHPVDSFQVAQSWRKPLAEIISRPA